MISSRTKKKYAKRLRRHQTRAERKLWPLWWFGFRPQVITPAGYIGDWYHKRAKVCVEADGGIHYKQRALDARRDSHHRRKGVLTLRFENSTIYKLRGFVVAYIVLVSALWQIYRWAWRR